MKVKSILLSLILAVFIPMASYAGGTIQWPTVCWFDSNGDPLSGGLLNSYVPGTSTRKALYTDREATVAHTNPEVLDANGCTEVYGVGKYKLVLTDSTAATTYFTDDNVTVSENSVSRYYPNYNAADQGATGNSDTIKYAVDTISTDSGEIHLLHNSGAATTTYTVDTSETIGSTINLVIENGAILSIATGDTLTIYSPNNIIASDTQYIFNDGNANHNGVAFTVGGRMSTGWWGAGDGDSITNAWNSVLAAIWSISGTQKSAEVVIPPGDYTMDDYTGAGKQKIDDASGVWIHGYGARITYDGAGGATGDFFLEIEDSDHIKVEGLYVDGDVATIGNTGNPLVFVASSDYVKFLNCSFINASKEGILVSDTAATLIPSKYGTIENCDLSGAARNGLALTGAQYWTILNTKIHDVAQVNGTAPKAGIDLEPVAADLIGIDIINCDIQNAAGAGIAYTNNTYDGFNINIRGGYIARDLDTASTYSIHTGTDAHGITVDGVYIVGEVYAEGQIDIINSHLISDATVTQGGHSCIRYLATVYDHVRLVNNRFEISGAYAKKFINVSSRAAATRPWTFLLDGNEFLTNGNAITAADVLTFNGHYTATDPQDVVIWRGNRFRHTGTAPGTPYYIDISDGAASEIWDVGNVFSDSLRYDSSTGWNLKLNNQNGIQRKSTILTAAADASKTWTNAIPAGAIVLSIRGELVGALTLAGGGTVWRLGDADADRWGETATVTDATALTNSAWTADTSAFLVTSATSIIWAPDAGTLTGSINIELIYFASPRF